MSETTAPAHTFTEAPASWNVRYSQYGFDCQLTIRADNSKDLLDRSKAAIQWLIENGAAPGHSNGKSIESKPTQEPPKLPDGSPDPAYCGIHHTAMKRYEKDGRAWYSHRLDDGSYCKGK